MRQKLIIGNWKMNGTLALIDSLLPEITRESLGSVAVAICPPTPYLESAAEQLRHSAIHLGAQNVSEHDGGAYTGESAAYMFRELGCTYALVGHSERRHYFAETDQLVSQKFAAAARAGLIPVLCIGETEGERDQGRTEERVCRQLDAILEPLGVAALVNAVIGYEPRWAIGTGNTATPAHAQAIHALIREYIARSDSAVAQSVQVLYGGSMKAANAHDLLAMPDIDGGLIGGASLDRDDFIGIIRAARSLAGS